MPCDAAGLDPTRYLEQHPCIPDGQRVRPGPWPYQPNATCTACHSSQERAERAGDGASGQSSGCTHTPAGRARAAMSSTGQEERRRRRHRCGRGHASSRVESHREGGRSVVLCCAARCCVVLPPSLAARTRARSPCAARLVGLGLGCDRRTGGARRGRQARARGQRAESRTGTGGHGEALPVRCDLRGLGSERAADPNATLARHMTVSVMRSPATPGASENGLAG